MKTEIKYLKLSEACGLTDRVMIQSVLEILDKTFLDNMVDFQKLFEIARSTVHSSTLGDYKEKVVLGQCWQLAHFLSVDTEWGYLHYDPRKSGIICFFGSESGETSETYFTKDLLPLSLDLSTSKALKNAFALRYSLGNWRSALCAVWGGMILKEMMTYLENQPKYLPISGDKSAFTRSMQIFMSQTHRLGFNLARWLFDCYFGYFCSH